MTATDNVSALAGAEDVEMSQMPDIGVVAEIMTGSSRNPFPPIGDYAFLSDCENSCLISSTGSVEWLCVPRPDSASVFGALLDRSAGHFRLGPHGCRCRLHAAICRAV
jgi:alpha,alpha-trehalase